MFGTACANRRAHNARFLFLRRVTDKARCGYASTVWTQISSTCLPPSAEYRHGSHSSQALSPVCAHPRTRLHSQATVYDNEHFVRYINVVEQLVNTATEHAPGGVRLRAVEASRALCGLTRSLLNASL